MKKYRLKPGQEAFQPVSGVFAGRRYERGLPYKENQIPVEEKGRFEEIKAASVSAPETAKKAAATDAAGVTEVIKK